MIELLGYRSVTSPPSTSSGRNSSVKFSCVAFGEAEKLLHASAVSSFGAVPQF